MMNLTTWGYSLDTDALTAFLSIDEYTELTAGKYLNDSRINANIDAATAAIRNYCGWHVFPSATCKMEFNAFDGRVTLAGSHILVQLPSTYVSEVTNVEIDGVKCEHYINSANGLLRIFDFRTLSEMSVIKVEYVSGIPESFMDSIKELVAHRVTHAMASSNGITSEAAGGVSVTYNAAWINNARATALPDDNKEVLQPYKLKGVF